MPAGRPSKIHDELEWQDPLTGEDRTTPITEAICRYIELGSYPTNAAGACGISANTLGNWKAKGAEHAPGPGKTIEDVPEDQRVFVEFLHDSTRAENAGLAWHEVNVRRAAGDRGRTGDGRLSLEFLARRQPSRYSKRIEIDTDPADREPAPIDTELSRAAEERFIADYVPEGVDPASILPALSE